MTSEEYFEKLVKGQDAPQPVGFPKEDVFKYDPSLADQLEGLCETRKLDWTQLKPWQPGETDHNI